MQAHGKILSPSIQSEAREMTFINGLHLDNVRGDLYGGITAGVVALPLALAFGVSSGAGPVACLDDTIFVGLFAALFGGTPAQVFGPSGPMTVSMAAIFTQYGVNAMLTKQSVIQLLANEHICEQRLEAYERAGKMLGVDNDKNL